MPPTSSTWPAARCTGQLSTSYFEYCDDALEAELRFAGDTVAIGLWRADFSLDRGRTWQDVSLPYRLTGGVRSSVDCPYVHPLGDGRLVSYYSRGAVADDPTNTRFRPLTTPPRTQLVAVVAGVVVAASTEPYAGRFASYDGGRSWQPLRATRLLRFLARQSW